MAGAGSPSTRGALLAVPGGAEHRGAHDGSPYGARTPSFLVSGGRSRRSLLVVSRQRCWSGGGWEALQRPCPWAIVVVSRPGRPGRHARSHQALAAQPPRRCLTVLDWLGTRRVRPRSRAGRPASFSSCTLRAGAPAGGDVPPKAPVSREMTVVCRHHHGRSERAVSRETAGALHRWWALGARQSEIWSRSSGATHDTCCAGLRRWVRASDASVGSRERSRAALCSCSRRAEMARYADGTSCLWCPRGVASTARPGRGSMLPDGDPNEKTSGSRMA